MYGGHGGADPPYGASPRLVFPPQRGLAIVSFQEANSQGANPGRATLSGVVSRVVHPQMAPLNLGIARIRWEYSMVALVPILTDLYRLSWEIYS